MATKQKLFPYQEQGVDFMAKVHGGILLADEQGLGKQQPWYSLVLTNNGWLPIGRLQVGDRVVGSNGDFTEVTGVFPQGVKDVYRLTFNDGSTCEAGPEHLWAMDYWKGGKAKTRVVKTTLEFLDDLETTKKTYYLPMLTNPFVGTQTQSELPIDPYFLGCLIANGSLGGRQMVLTVGTVDWPCVQQRLSGDATGNVFQGNVETRGTVTRIGYRVALRDSVEQLELNCKSVDKFIPKVYLEASAKDRISLLQGLMDCDGSISKTRNRLSYSTISPRLARDIVTLVQSLGGVATLHQYDRSHQGKPIEFCVCLRLPAGILPFSVIRKAGRYVPGPRALPSRRLVSIERLECPADSYCISVAAEDKLYVTDQYILTHNTAQVATLAARQSLWPLLIVCPASLKGNWQRELKMWADADSLVVEGKSLATLPDELPKAVIVNYDILYDQRPLLGRYQWKCIAFDEVHNLSNRASKRTKAAKYLSRLTTKVIGMSGTPVMNRPADFWPILNIIRPELFPAWQAYATRYCEPRKTHWGWEYKGATNLGELHEKIKPFMLRRLKEDVLDLPEKKMIVVPLHLDDRSDLDAAEADFMGWLAQNSKYGSVTSAQKAEAVTRLGILLRLTSRLKARAVVDWSRKFFRDNSKEKLILFAVHTQMVDVLKRRILPEENVVVIDGSTPTKKRQGIVDRFQTDPQCRLLVGNIKAAGVGLTLTAASTIANAEMWWTPAVMAQGADRVHRIGQKETCDIYYLVVPDTVEERICKAIQTKQQVANSIVDGRQAATMPVLDLLLSETGGLLSGNKRPHKTKH